MSPRRRRYLLRERRSSGHLPYDATSQETDSEDKEDRTRPRFMKPWIVDLLLDYDESDEEPEAEYGHVVKVLSEASLHCQDGQEPAAVVYLGDSLHYIHTVVPARAIQTAENFPPQSGFSSILGQIIVLQNFRVCVKEAARAEDSGFYFKLDSFCVTAMKRWVTRQRDCNRVPSVLQKIKELWLRGLALQPLPNSEPSSVAEVLEEMKQDKLSILKQNVEGCFSPLDPRNPLNSEQLAVYPDTKWQAERKQDKMRCRDVFTVPAKLLVIGAEEEAALSKSYPPKPAHVASDNESSSDEDQSTVSFVSAEADTVDDSLENPWDIFPGMTLTSSKEMSDTQPSLPNVQPTLLASTAEEEEASGSSSCTPDGLQPCDSVPHCSSVQVEPAEVTSPSLLPLYKEGVDQESRSKAQNSTYNTSRISDTDESILCGHPLNNSNSHASGRGLSPVCPTIRSTFLSKTSSGDVDHPAHLQREMVVVRGAGEKSLETCRKYGAAKRKQVVPDEEESTETSPRPLRTSGRAHGVTSAEVFPESRRLVKKQIAQKPPLKFVTESTPKKSRIEEIHVQPLQPSAHSKRARRPLEKLKEQTASTGRLANSCGGQLGGQQQERVRRGISHHVYPPATAELCSQVHSTRISRALLGWARWVFRNRQKL